MDDSNKRKMSDNSHNKNRRSDVQRNPYRGSDFSLVFMFFLYIMSLIIVRKIQKLRKELMIKVEMKRMENHDIETNVVNIVIVILMKKMKI